MKRKQFLTKGLLALSLVAQNFTFAGKAQAKSVERPPQFVIFAFDGSYTNEVWKYSRDFTKRQKQYGVDNRFTFFINPVYLVAPEKKSIYKAPTGYNGSAIGWGDDKQDVAARIDEMNEAFLEGHEIANHAVGHHDGSKWSKDDWDLELKQFNYILDNVFNINGITRTKKGYTDLKFDYRRDVVGFRAPLLGFSNGLWPALKNVGIKYDTSQKAAETYWPRKVNGLWNFPLALIQEPGSDRKWVSMDYNFCYRDSLRIRTEEPSVMSFKASDPMLGVVKGNGDKNCLRSIPERQKKAVKANMMNLYRSYFAKNYYGNRAPLHIGHHFSQWMSGAYFEAFFEFANEVCSKPEVKCVTYKELMEYMEEQPSSKIDAFERGQFAKLTRPKSVAMARSLDIQMTVSVDESKISLGLAGKDASIKGLKKFVTVNGHRKSVEKDFTLADLRKLAKQDDVVRFSLENRLGQEISSAVIEVKGIGTGAEHIGTENIEDRALVGHMDGAHADERSFLNKD